MESSINMCYHSLPVRIMYMTMQRSTLKCESTERHIYSLLGFKADHIICIYIYAHMYVFGNSSDLGN